MPRLTCTVQPNFSPCDLSRPGYTYMSWQHRGQCCSALPHLWRAFQTMKNLLCHAVSQPGLSRNLCCSTSIKHRTPSEIRNHQSSPKVFQVVMAIWRFPAQWHSFLPRLKFLWTKDQLLYIGSEQCSQVFYCIGQFAGLFHFLGHLQCPPGLRLLCSDAVSSPCWATQTVTVPEKVYTVPDTGALLFLHMS